MDQRGTGLCSPHRIPPVRRGREMPPDSWTPLEAERSLTSKTIVLVRIQVRMFLRRQRDT